MKPISSISQKDAADISVILTDIDDTLTKNGKLLSETYDSLWKLKAAGLMVVPVTGRPAGWCDMIARQWPVSGVVGENGAFACFVKDGIMQTVYHPSVESDNMKMKLEEIKKAVLTEVPGCRVSKDQFSRKYDLAIDFNEESPHLGLEAAEQIKAVCERFGAVAKISSIHVNTWFGDYDKLSMSKVFIEKTLGIKNNLKDKVFFCGDSPNDEPMFAFFKKSCAVRNIEQFLPLINHKPQYISLEEYGIGFAEIADILISKRKNINLF